MSETFFTSDSHFGHVNILEFEREARPFADINEMNWQLIQNWNNAVKPNDKVYHLGDFCFGRKNLELAVHLNGHKRLIMGNHDHYPIAEYAKYFEKIYGAKFWEQCLLTHIPVHPNQLSSRWLLNVHGHLHSNVVSNTFSKWTQDVNYFNVSVERHNLTPVNADIIRKYIKDNDL